jgi:hypothetical protein
MRRFALLFVLVVAVTAHASPIWVAVKKTTIRKAASNLSPVVARVNYQDELDLLSENGDWWQVSHGDQQGWVHKSALSKSLQQAAGSQQKSSGGSIFDALRGRSGSQSQQSGARGRGGDAEDITLAGKGFNEDVEGEFKAQGGDLDYAAVDIMENREVPGFDFQKFADEGGLQYVIEQAKIRRVEQSGEGEIFE